MENRNMNDNVRNTGYIYSREKLSGKVDYLIKIIFSDKLCGLLWACVK